MATEVRWSSRAVDELTRALDYLRLYQPDAVDTVEAAISSQVERLTWQPYLGSVYDRSSHGDVRETFAANYRIFYRVEDDGAAVEIQSIRHAKRRDPRF
jgi:plasmid stabilization system protein ParE